MPQTAINDLFTFPPDDWTLISEINCTFVARTAIEIIVDSSKPGPEVYGVRYDVGQGEDVSTDTLSRFPGAAASTGIYVICRGGEGEIFLSRAAT